MTTRNALLGGTFATLAALFIGTSTGTMGGCEENGGDDDSESIRSDAGTAAVRPPGRDAGGSMHVTGGSGSGRDNGGSGTTTARDGSVSHDTGAGARLEAGLQPAAVDGANDAPTDVVDADGKDADAYPGCTADFEPCDATPQCCFLQCLHGACGGRLAEGERCGYDGGVAPPDATACVDDLPCVGGACGTNSCLPDGRECGDASLCCNNDCTQTDGGPMRCGG